VKNRFQNSPFECNLQRYAAAVCYNPPWIFAVFWKAISPFIGGAVQIDPSLPIALKPPGL
jgi:hypothetical protein